MNEESKQIVSVAEMARMVGLSRARFYQLVGTTFPFPLYDVTTHRPFYNEELQAICLEVRKRNFGINGKPILFYSRRGGGAAPLPRSVSKKSQDKQFAFVLEGVKSLGMTAAKMTMIEAAIKELYPGGSIPSDSAELIRAVFIHLMRQNRGGNVG